LKLIYVLSRYYGCLNLFSIACCITLLGAYDIFKVEFIIDTAIISIFYWKYIPVVL